MTYMLLPSSWTRPRRQRDHPTYQQRPPQFTHPPSHSFQFCWRCLRPWRRDTHDDFFSCTLPPAARLQGAADAFDHHDKKATALVALRNRALALQRRLRARPPSTPSPSVLSLSLSLSLSLAPPPAVGVGVAAGVGSLVETDLALEALEAVQVK
jgi:hypothetical protein